MPCATQEEAQKLQKKLGGVLVSKDRQTYQKLPRLSNGEYCKTFKTEDHTYRIIPPGEAIGFERWGELYKMLLFMQTGVRSYDEVKAKLGKFMSDLIGVAKQGENQATVWAIQQLSEVGHATGEILSWQYDLSDYIASIFIIRDDEDLTGWKRSFAEEKIADWDANKYDRNDFFFLSMGLSKQYLTDYQSRAEHLSQQLYRTPTDTSKSGEG